MPVAPWSSVPTPITAGQHFETLRWYSGELMADDYVAGACHFVTGPTSDWVSFDIVGTPVQQMLADYQEVVIEPPPNGGNGETPMPDDPFVIDVRGADDPDLAIVPRIETYQQMLDHWPVTIDRSQGEEAVEVGEQYWRLVGYEIKGGAPTLQPQVKESDGSAADQIIVLFHWPESDVEPLPPSIQPRYFELGVWGQTDGGGSVGIGLGGYALVYSVWLSEDNVRLASDMSSGHGMKANTNHVVNNPIFQAVVKEGTGNGGQPPPTAEGDLVELKVGGVTVYKAKIKVTVEQIV